MSVIIVDYNGGDNILSCIESVFRYGGEEIAEIIVVDNGSSDGSVERIAKLFASNPKVKLVLLKRNVGFAMANNLGFRLATGRFCTFLNQDVVVQNGWLREAVKAFNMDKRVVVVQPKIVQMINPKIIDSCGGFINRIGIACERGNGEVDGGQYDVGECQDIFYAKGAAFILDKLRLPFSDMSLFDDDYFMYYEDVDLCWRLRLAGMRVIFCPKSKVCHIGGVRVRGTTPTLIFHQEKNRLLTLIKNYELVNAVVFGFFLVLAQAYLAFRFFVRGNHAKATAVLLALLWNFRNIRTTLRKRHFVQQYRKVPDSSILKLFTKLNPPELMSKLRIFT